MRYAASLHDFRELAREPPAAGHREYAGDATDVSKELAQDFESCIFDVGAVTCFPQHSTS